mgnify:CR=1 FL=1
MMATHCCARALALAGALMLGACASAPLPGPVQEVRIPVPVPCKTPDIARPNFAVDALPLKAGVWRQMQALRSERLQRQGYEAELEAAVRACQ